MKTIVLTGGGSGGHITPLLAVAAELKLQQPEVNVVYIGQRGDALLDVPAGDKHIDAVFSVSAGKFRRYHGEGLRALIDFRTIALNIRDVFRVALGLLQSYRLLGKVKPEVVFSRGGFVSVPVALAARLRHIPYITHDSDTTPSLANRIIARWAHLHAVALPKEMYPYPVSKTVTVGVPINEAYQPVTPELKGSYKQALGLMPDSQVVLITGGGNGARDLNMIAAEQLGPLLAQREKLVIVHLAGKGLVEDTIAAYTSSSAGQGIDRLLVEPFVSDLYRYSGAADVVIARGGATNIAEFAQQGKACLIIPSPQLIWNVKNTEQLAQQAAVIDLQQDRASTELATVLTELLDDSGARQTLEAAIARFAQPHAAERIAQLLLEMRP